MPLTDHSDVYADFHEDGFNSIVQHVMLQRPSLFNYATADLVTDRYEPRLCEAIKFHPAVKSYGNPLVTVVPYLPIIGYSGPYGMSYCFQLRDVKIDFHPGNIIDLPPELSPPLAPQKVALHATVCAGMACPDRRSLDHVAGTIKPDDPREEDGREDELPTRPFRNGKLHCFCLDLCAVLRIVFENGAILLKVDDLELKDIRPEAMENAFECYLLTVLQLTILPKLRISLDDLLLELPDFLPLAPAAVPGDVPFNPTVENDRLAVFFNLS